MQEILVETRNRKQAVNITSRIQEVVSKKGIENGIVFLYCPHTTAGLYINEGFDSSVKKDFLKKLSDIAPLNSEYFHTEGNADAHIQSTLTGNQLFVFVRDGKLVLGQWQSIFFAEFDGPRRRRIHVKTITC